MKIPIEATVLHRSESEQRAFAEKARSGPIDAAAGMRASLTDAKQPKRASEKPGKKASHHPVAMSETFVQGERRRRERRKENLPVVLDTRLGQRRRQTPSGNSVNYTI